MLVSAGCGNQQIHANRKDRYFPYFRAFRYDRRKTLKSYPCRDDVALYTGNDDHIVLDLIGPYQFRAAGKAVERKIVGGLLGHWAVWTSKAAKTLEVCRAVAENDLIPIDMFRLAADVTDANAAVFDVAHGFAGCIAGIHEVLRRQGLLEGVWCLDPKETLSEGQSDELDRIYREYPHLTDDEFVAEHRDQWLSD